MSNTARTLTALLALLVPVAAGCTQIAASAAGGAVPVVGSQFLVDTAQETVTVDIGRAERLTTSALADLDICILGTSREHNAGVVTKSTVEACLLGNDVIALDVELERLTNRLTQIRVTARRGPLEPEVTVSERVLARIARDAPLVE